MNTLETIIQDIIEHDKAHPDHGIGCICMDGHTRKIRALMSDMGLKEFDKSRQNLKIVLGHICR